MFLNGPKAHIDELLISFPLMTQSIYNICDACFDDLKLTPVGDMEDIGHCQPSLDVEWHLYP